MLSVLTSTKHATLQTRMYKHLDEGAEYTKAAEFLMDFHTPKENSGAFHNDKDMNDYQWLITQDKDGS